MRLLIKNKENNTYAAVEADRIEYDKDLRNVVVGTSSGNVIIENVDEEGAKNLIGSAVSNGYVSATRYEATIQTIDDIDWDENSDIFDM